MSGALPKLGIGVGVMAKAPELGRVKTRLAKDVGETDALLIYEELLLRVEYEVAQKSLSGGVSGVSVYLFVDPPDQSETLAKAYPRFARTFPQDTGDLGARMSSALRALLEKHDKAALIGVDVPDLTLEHIEAASSALEGVDVVFAPASDGGYSLIGLKNIHEELFANVPWSAPNTLSVTIDRCSENNISYALIETLEDLDTLSDFKKISWRPKDERLRRIIADN